MSGTVNVVLTGGIGNQMLQYAFGRGLQSRGRTVTFNRQSYGSNVRERKPEDFVPSPTDLSRDEYMEYVCAYGLDMFKTKMTFGPTEGRFIDGGVEYCQDFFDATGPITLRGLWWSERYFENIASQIREELTPLSLPGHIRVMGDALASENSVALHVRRGDYLLPEVIGHHGRLRDRYYEDALNIIEGSFPNPRVYVFSDDTKWCDSHMPGITVNAGDRYQQLWLMSRCQHAVIVHSTYSWWAAFLGDTRSDRMVIAPKVWFAHRELKKITTIPPARWMTI